jgi:hypothetical protein
VEYGAGNVATTVVMTGSGPSSVSQ